MPQELATWVIGFNRLGDRENFEFGDAYRNIHLTLQLLSLLRHLDHRRVSRRGRVSSAQDQTSLIFRGSNFDSPTTASLSPIFAALRGCLYLGAASHSPGLHQTTSFAYVAFLFASS